MMNEIQRKIEALLFYKNEPLPVHFLSKVLSEDQEVIENELESMIPLYHKRGIQMIVAQGKAALVTHRDLSSFIHSFVQEEEDQGLSKQTLDTLAIILYKGLVTKPEIDYIRGVNSSYTLRNLLLRGLIEKVPNKKDKRTPLYRATPETFSFLGIERREDLPHFSSFREKMKEIERAFQEESVSQKEKNLDKNGEIEKV